MKKKGDTSNIFFGAVSEDGKEGARPGHTNGFKLRGAFPKVMLEAQEKYPRMLQVGAPVSYTHLTLPTILLV